MSPVVQQILTLVGVLLGAGATFTATTLTERAKWRRGLDTRWDEKRMTAYVEYADALKRYTQLAYRLAATQGYRTKSHPIDLEEGERELADASSRRTVKWESVLLLGSPAAVAAGRKWHEAAWELRFGTTEPASDPESFQPLYKEVVDCRDAFYACARADLGVRSGALPPSYRELRPGGGPIERTPEPTPDTAAGPA